MFRSIYEFDTSGDVNLKDINVIEDACNASELIFYVDTNIL